MLHENGTKSKLGKHTADRRYCSAVARGCGINGIGCWNKESQAAELRDVCSAFALSRLSGNRRCAIGVPAESQFLWELSTTFQDSFGSRLPLRAEP